MIVRQRKPILFAVLAAMLSISGCLSESDDESAAESPAAPPSGNRAPLISGNPQSTVTVGGTYSFTPTASDPDGDTLSFSIENRPSWANFDSLTGRLSGNPTLANIGTFADIRISVSDGIARTDLTSFNVEVTQVALGSASLSWTAPTQNEDGSALTDLAGYKIYYGRASGNYTDSIQINNASISSYLVENLQPDTYYFAATSFNSAGVESRFSDEAVTTVD